MSHEPHEVVITEDPAHFLALATEHLAADPVLTTVVSSVTHRALAQVEQGLPAPGAPALVGRGPRRVRAAWSAWRCGPPRSRRTRCSCCRCRTTPPWPWPGRCTRPRGGARRRQRGAAGAQVVADEAARLQGVTASVWEHTRLFELGELVEPAPAEGRLRRADRRGHRPVPGVVPGLRRRRRRAGRAATGDEPQEEYFTARGHGRADRRPGGSGSGRSPASPVHLTGFNPPSFGVARVGPVYTPAGAPRSRLRQRRGRRGVPAAARRGRAGLPLHRPGEPDLQPDLPGAGLPARRGHGELRGRLTRP